MKQITYSHEFLVHSTAFVHRIMGRADLTSEQMKTYLNANNIEFKITENDVESIWMMHDLTFYIQDKDYDKVDEWTENVRRSMDLNNTMHYSEFLHSLHSRETGKKSLYNVSEKLRKSFLKSSFDLYCGHVYPNNPACVRLAHAVLLSYKNNGYEIDSVKDFKKIIERDAGAEFVRIKFIDESQAAEFMLQYGCELQG